MSERPPGLALFDPAAAMARALGEAWDKAQLAPVLDLLPDRLSEVTHAAGGPPHARPEPGPAEPGPAGRRTGNMEGKRT